MEGSKGCFNMKYKNVCVHSKGALVVLATSILLTTTTIISGGLSTQFIESYSYIIFAAVGLHYLFYPLLGLLGEKWMRYKVVLVGIILTFVGFIIILVTLVAIHFINLNKIVVVCICLFGSSFYFFGYGLYEANVIQFGTDQLQFAPSQELSSFVYWVLYIYYFPLAILLLAASIMTGFIYRNIIYYTFTSIFGSGVLIVIIAILSFCCFKKHLVIEPAQHNNPVKLIWRVIKYAWKHKIPQRRSAFTYGEPPPSRLDLAKERYGGPFTTGQVEDVKSFLYILSVLLTAYGITFSGFSSNLSNQYLAVLNLGINKTAATFTEKMILQFPLTIPFFVFAMYILTFQLLIVPFFSRFIPSMLKRIWIGLVGVLLQLVITTAIAYIVNRDITRSFDNIVCLDVTGHNTSNYDAGMEIFTLPYLILILPQFLSGVNSVVIAVTGFEFILAQGPRNMQGLLIGLWLMEANIYIYININRSFCHWEYYAIVTTLALISVIIYTIAAYKYKYRQRNEQSDVNERIIITEYTERQLLRKYNTRLEDQLHYDVDSMIINQ